MRSCLLYSATVGGEVFTLIEGVDLYMYVIIEGVLLCKQQPLVHCHLER